MSVTTPRRAAAAPDPDRLTRGKAAAAAFHASHGPFPPLEDLLDPDQIAEAMAALNARQTSAPLSPALTALRDLEGGKVPDPTWNTLHRCATAVGLKLVLTAVPGDAPAA